MLYHLPSQSIYALLMYPLLSTFHQPLSSIYVQRSAIYPQIPSTLYILPATLFDLCSATSFSLQSTLYDLPSKPICLERYWNFFFVFKLRVVSNTKERVLIVIVFISLIKYISSVTWIIFKNALNIY